MNRKRCGDCGETSLESETSCWACGSSHFAGSDQTIVGDRTIMLGENREITMSWTAYRHPRAVVLWVLAAGAFAFFMCVVGYWIGRASSPEPAITRQGLPQVQPVPLPTPPTGLTGPVPMAAASLPATPAAAVAADPAMVSVRTRPGTVPARAGGAVPAQLRRVTDPLGSAPVPLVYGNPHLSSSTAPGVVSRTPATAPTTPANHPVVASPPPSRSTAVVTIRNDAPMQVEVAVDGTGSQTAVIAPGGAAILTLNSGAYQMRVSGGGISSGGASLGVASGRSYSLTVSRRQEGDRDGLVLIEPAVDGSGG